MTSRDRTRGGELLRSGGITPAQYAAYAQAANVKMALDNGNKILMSPAGHTFLDIKYDKSIPYGLTWINGGYVDLARTYQWDPDTAVRDGSGGKLAIDDSQVLGVEFALWSVETNQPGVVPWTAAASFDPVSKYMVTMMFPGPPAIAEIAWSHKAGRAGSQSLLDDFEARLVDQAQGWDAAGIGYCRAPDVHGKSTGAPALPKAVDVTVGELASRIGFDDTGNGVLTVVGDDAGAVTDVHLNVNGADHLVTGASASGHAASSMADTGSAIDPRLFGGLLLIAGVFLIRRKRRTPTLADNDYPNVKD